MIKESLQLKMYGVLLIVTFVISAMVLISLTGNAAIPTPTIEPTLTPTETSRPSSTQALTPATTRRSTPTPTRRITPTGRRRGTTWASTGAATNITATSATLHGSFSYEWELFYGWFEYWETADPSTRKSTTSISYLNYALNVSVTIYNLKPNTQYTYLATMGIAKGTERSFTTLAEGVTPTLAAVSPTATPRISPTPTRRRDAPTISRRGASASTRPATNITSTTATLSANVSSNGHRLEIWYEYWEAASPDVKMTTSSRSYLNIVTIDTRDVSGLQPDTAYVYRAVIKVYYLGLNPLTLYMNQVSFTTLP